MKVFKELDKDSDGTITIEELMALAKVKKEDDAAIKTAKKEAKEVLDLMDTNKDGKLSEDEWKKAFGEIFEALKKTKEDSKEPQDIIEMIIGEAKSREEAEANAEGAYKKMDKNEDGTVNASEFLELIEAGGHKITDAIKKDVDEMIKLIDTDSDGKMTLEEFKTAFGTVYEKLNGSDN